MVVLCNKCQGRVNTFYCNLWMIVLFHVFSLLLCRNKWCAWSVTGHRTSSLVLCFGLLCTSVPGPVMGVYAVGCTSFGSCCLVTLWEKRKWGWEDEQSPDLRANMGGGGTHMPVSCFSFYFKFSCNSFWFLSGKAFIVRWIMIFMYLNLGICLINYLNPGK